MSEWTIEDCIESALSLDVLEDDKERCLSELRSLRAEAAKVEELERRLSDEQMAHMLSVAEWCGRNIALAAEAAAWRAVRAAWESKATRGEAAKYAGYVLREQIARLDAMKEGA